MALNRVASQFSVSDLRTTLRQPRPVPEYIGAAPDEPLVERAPYTGQSARGDLCTYRNILASVHLSRPRHEAALNKRESAATAQ